MKTKTDLSGKAIFRGLITDIEKYEVFIHGNDRVKPISKVIYQNI
jgi:hypothetical protein